MTIRRRLSVLFVLALSLAVSPRALAQDEGEPADARPPDQEPQVQEPPLQRPPVQAPPVQTAPVQTAPAQTQDPATDAPPASPSPDPSPEPDDDGNQESDDQEGDAYWRRMIFTPRLQAFAEYQLDVYDEAGATEVFHNFDVPRVWVGLGWALGDARAGVLFEGTRSAGEGSLVGVGGDSIVVRFREAWVGYRAWDLFELRAGLVPTLIAPATTRAWGMRPVAQSALRRFELMAPADLGATLTFDIPEDFGRLGVSFANGEGYRGRELNRGKNTEFFAEVRPLAFIPELRPLTVMAGYQMGSIGTGLARQDRLVGVLAWMDARFGAGVGATWVLGFEDRGDQEGALLEGWVRGNPYEGLLLAARAQYFSRNMSAQGDEMGEFTAAVGYRLFDVVAAFLAFDGRFAGDAARATLPGYERWRLRVVVEGRFSTPIPLAF